MRRAFTLIELLIVVSIIGLLVAALVMIYSSTKARSRDARRMADVDSITKSLELYQVDYKKYPLTLNDLVPEYLRSTPLDPLTSTVYTYTFIDDDNYTIEFCLETDSVSNYPEGCYTLP